MKLTQSALATMVGKRISNIVFSRQNGTLTIFFSDGTSLVLEIEIIGNYQMIVGIEAASF